MRKMESIALGGKGLIINPPIAQIAHNGQKEESIVTKSKRKGRTGDRTRDFMRFLM